MQSELESVLNMESQGLINAANIEQKYIEIIFPLIRAIYQEAMIIGIFVVAFGLLRDALKNSGTIKQSLFWQRGLLLFVVMCWTTNILISYNLYARSVDGPELITTARDAEVLSLLMRAMIPVELSVGVILALMYGSLAYRDYVSTSGPASLRLELTALFSLTALNHTAYVFWFLIVYGITGRISGDDLAALSNFSLDIFFDKTPSSQPILYNVAFHIVAACLYSVLLLFWRAISKLNFYKTHYAPWDWIGVIFYSAVILTWFNTRMDQYLSTLHQG